MRLSRCWRGSLFAALSILSASAGEGADATLTAPGAHLNARFSEYPSIATAESVSTRLLSPFAAEEIRRKVRLSGKRLESAMFDINGESFVVYVPRSQPPEGYGLLVFVPPWPDAELPSGWPDVLDRNGVIFVNAQRSGNDAPTLERRVPLALAELATIRKNFRIDPARTFVGGFSGGSRVALRIALAYPDLFTGVMLNSGSDPIGGSSTPLPPPDLFAAFQTRTRIAFVTGQEDQGGQAADAAAQTSLQHWCVSNVSIRDEQRVGHQLASPQSLDWALKTISAGSKRDSSSFASCRAARLREVDAAMTRIEQSIDRGDVADAKRLLTDANAKYGGLAASRLIALADRCSCGILDPLPASSASGSRNRR